MKKRVFLSDEPINAIPWCIQIYVIINNMNDSEHKEYIVIPSKQVLLFDLSYKIAKLRLFAP